MLCRTFAVRRCHPVIPNGTGFLCICRCLCHFSCYLRCKNRCHLFLSPMISKEKPVQEQQKEHRQQYTGHVPTHILYSAGTSRHKQLMIFITAGYAKNQNQTDRTIPVSVRKWKDSAKPFLTRSAYFIRCPMCCITGCMYQTKESSQPQQGVLCHMCRFSYRIRQ